jgi:hypothetical protein
MSDKDSNEKTDNKLKDFLWNNDFNPLKSKPATSEVPKDDVLKPKTMSEEIDNCYDFFKFFSKCVSSSFQIDQVHKYGQANICQGRFQDWRKCLSAKLIKDENDRIVSRSSFLDKFLFYSLSHFRKFIRQLNFMKSVEVLEMISLSTRKSHPGRSSLMRVRKHINNEI